MKVKFTLEEKESKSLYQVLENIPTNLCDYVDCPDMDGDACENCPMAIIQLKWSRARDIMHKEIPPMIKEIER